MDEYLDIVWFKIEAVILWVMQVMDALVSPLNALGPATVIFMLVFVVVCITKLFKRFYSTKRYEELKNEFNHWSEIRKHALGVEDREKGKFFCRKCVKFSIGLLSSAVISQEKSGDSSSADIIPR